MKVIKKKLPRTYTYHPPILHPYLLTIPTYLCYLPSKYPTSLPTVCTYPTSLPITYRLIPPYHVLTYTTYLPLIYPSYLSTLNIRPTLSYLPTYLPTLPTQLTILNLHILPTYHAYIIHPDKNNVFTGFQS